MTKKQDMNKIVANTIEKDPWSFSQPWTFCNFPGGVLKIRMVEKKCKLSFYMNY